MGCVHLAVIADIDLLVPNFASLFATLLPSILERAWICGG